MTRRQRSTRDEKLAWLRAHLELLTKPYLDVLNAMKKAGLYAMNTGAVDAQASVEKLITEARRAA